MFNTLACLTLVSLLFQLSLILYSHVLIFKIIFTLVCVLFINPLILWIANMIIRVANITQH